MSLEDVFSDRTSTRILLLLANNDVLTITQIARATNASRMFCKKKLKKLMDLGLVKEKQAGRVRMYLLNLENERAKLIKVFMEKWQGLRADEEGRKSR